MQLLAVEVFTYMFTIFIFNYNAQFVCVKDKAYLRIAIPAHCFNILDQFCYLICLVIKKVILGGKTI